MAEQMASDPSFQAITQQLAGMGLAPGAMAGMPGAPPGAAAEPAASESTADSTNTTAQRSLPAGIGSTSAGGIPGMPAPGANGAPVDPDQYMKARILGLAAYLCCLRRSVACSCDPFILLLFPLISVAATECFVDTIGTQ